MRDRGNKRYNYSEVRKLLELVGKGTRAKEAAEALNRPVRGVERQLYVVKRALKLDLEERKDFLERNHANVSLINKAISDHLAESKTEEAKGVEESFDKAQGKEAESGREPDDLLELEERLSQAREAFEETIVDYALAASREIYREKIGRVKDRYKDKIRKMKKKIKDLEVVVDGARKSNLSYNIRQRLLGNK